jgi:D-alanyl-D-alanine carboxypeptidase
MAHHDDASTYADLLARLGDDGTMELFRRLLEQAPPPKRRVGASEVPCLAL